MGGVVEALSFDGMVMSTAASLLGKDRAERDYYRSMASAAEEQAQQIETAAKRNVEYIAQDTAYQSRQLTKNYASLLGEQKTAFAANGLGSNSATAQLILKNSRLNAQFDEEMLVQNMQRSIYETNTQAALQAQQYRNQAKQYEKARRTRAGFWDKLGSAFSGMLVSFGGSKL